MPDNIKEMVILACFQSVFRAFFSVPVTPKNQIQINSMLQNELNIDNARLRVASII